jgi:ADA HAT complex component 1
MVEDGSDVEGAQERRGSRPALHGCFEKGEASRDH